MLTMDDLAIDPEKSRKLIETFIRNHIRSAKASGSVIGMSGGLDSSAVTKLCANALGPENVLGLVMPAGAEEADTVDAVELAKSLGIAYEVVNIRYALKAYQKSCKHLQSKKKIPGANLIPRIRMAILYYHANLMNYLVVGTGNKSELLSGYFTKYGDGSADILPIGDLYKTQVRKLAKHIGIPEHILKKAPSAGLWKGQTDEGEMGIRYSELDLILFASSEKGLSEKEILSETKLSSRKIALVMEKLRRSRHKREMPPVAKIR